jgi:hypothetical protein
MLRCDGAYEEVEGEVRGFRFYQLRREDAIASGHDVYFEDALAAETSLEKFFFP